MVGNSAMMARLYQAIEKIAVVEAPVLINGESGTGKELTARAIHEHSPRREGPFNTINCGALPAGLIQSELFGHEKGAFTGADARRQGRFEAADGGTLLLDEVGDMPLETQAKVLRVLQERTFERVGGTRPIAVDVRVVAATHRNLEQQVREGSFRQDLYYRLRVVTVELPPLRQRTGDVPALADRFLTLLADRLGRPKPTLSAGALARLRAHAWPGNVRELRNVVEQAAVLCSGDAITEDDLQLEGPSTGELAGAVPLELPFAEAKRQVVDAFERAYLREHLRRHGGNVSRTAEAIGMVRQSLQQKMRDLGLRDVEG
jgi:two-component system, NtrC family, nitrogen regulation response regulator NtrX